MAASLTTGAELQHSRHRSPPTLTAESIVLLSKDRSATLPPAADPAALLALLDCPSSPVPVAAYLSALLSLLSRSPPSPSFLSSLLLSFLRLFRSRRLPLGDAALILRLFAPHLPSLDRADLPSLLDLIISDLPAVAEPDDALPLDLLPRLLDLAGGGELLDQVVERLLAADWSKPFLLKVVALLRELPAIGRARFSNLLEKIFLGMKGVDLQDLPTLVYQLLLLASKGINRREVIWRILGFFGGFSKGPPSILRQVEGTVLMHVNFAVKQDPSLGQEVLSVIRSDLRLLNHFVVAVLFSVARVRRFNESSIGVLRTAVVTSHRDYKISRDCKWLPDSLKVEYLETAKFVENSFLKAVNESNSGREHVVPSIVQFGFLLLELVDGENGEQESGSAGLTSIEELSIEMLKTLFEVHDMSRNEIIEQCKFRILSLKPQKSMAIIKLLGNLVQSYPYPMLENVAHLKELLDYFTFLQERTAMALIDALLPLIRFSHDLQDYVILVVRKAMFKREESVRIAATDAIINLISVENKYKRISVNSLQESSSQASCSQQADIPSRMEGGLFQELSGLLRRCLSQQARVKEILYEGLVKLVMLEPSISSSILDILWTHFMQIYFEEKDFPLQLDACFKLENGKVCVVEPLDHLLSCVSWLLLVQSQSKSEHQSEDFRPCFGFSLSQENEAGKATSAELLSNALFTLRRNLKNCNLQDAQGHREDSSSHSLQVEKHSFHCQILLRIVEVLVNIVATDLEKAEGENKAVFEKEVMEFTDLYESLEKESSMNKQRSGNRKASARELLDKVHSESKECAQVTQAKTFFATSTVHHLLLTAIKSCNLYFSNRHIASQRSSEQSTAVDLCLKMMSFVLKVCLRHLKSFDAIRNRSSSDPFRALLCGDIRHLAKPVMQLVWLLKSILEQDKDPKKKDAKGKMNRENKGEQLFLSLLCLNELFKMNLSGAKLSKLVDDLLSLAAPELDLEATGNGVQGINQEQSFLDEHMQKLHLFLEKGIEPLYSSVIDTSLFRESEVLAELLLITGKKLTPAQRNSHGSWAKSICQSRKVENPSAARSVLSLAIYLIPAPTDLIVAHDMASELMKVIGSEDKDPEERSEKFPVINRSTRNAIATVILQAAESCIVELSWAVSKVKAISTGNHEQSGIRKNLQFGEKLLGVNLEEALYARSEALVYLLSCFVEMNLKDSQAEQLLKVTTKFYKLLALMTKLQIAPKGSKQFLPSAMFQKLSEVTCTRLTSPLYNFVAFVQRNQQESSQHRGIINKIKRENRCIPDLIFQIEDYEKYLIQLSKLSKVNLLRHAKRSTARDFKILEMIKVAVDEEARECEPTPSSPASGNESNGESEGLDEENMPKEIASPEPDGAVADEDSENDKDDQEMLIRKKRTKMSEVVEDSDEEA